jgi:hypothetical protein
MRRKQFLNIKAGDTHSNHCALTILALSTAGIIKN